MVNSSGLSCMLSASTATGSMFVDLTNHRLKVFEKKISRTFQRTKFEFTAYQQLFMYHLHFIYNYLHSIYIILGSISNLERRCIGYMKYHAV